jgi:FlaA1/EpsC-like NDP-sugar epimerase
LFEATMSPRKALIIAHDLIMTAAAIVASFYIRFEGPGLAEHVHGLVLVLPPFLVYAGFIYFLFHLYESKWRFASLPDLMNIVRAASVLAMSLLVVDYVLVAPNVFGQYFFGKITIALYWVLQMVFLGGPLIAYLLPLYPHPPSCARNACQSHPHSRPCRRRRRAAALDRERRRHKNLAGWNPLAVAR